MSKWDNLAHWEQQGLLVLGLIAIGSLGMIVINRASKWYVNHLDQNQQRAGEQGQMIGQLRLRRRDTQQRVFTAIARSALLMGLILSAIYLFFPKEGSILWGTTLALAIAGFALQPYLRDIIAGIAMMAEGWFEIGDTISVEPMGVSGVVEHFNLRSTQMRTVAGEKVIAHNGAMWSVSVARRGVKQFRMEFFIRDLEAGKDLIERVSLLLPNAKTHVAKDLKFLEQEELSENMFRLVCSMTTPAGREWIAEDLAVKFFQEQDRDNNIVHGPVVYSADPVGERRIRQSILPE